MDYTLKPSQRLTKQQIIDYFKLSPKKVKKWKKAGALHYFRTSSRLKEKIRKEKHHGN